MHEDRQHNALAALDVFANMARADAGDRVFVIRYLNASKKEVTVEARGATADEAEAKARRQHGIMWGDIVSVTASPGRSDAAKTETVQIGGKSFTIKEVGPKEWRYEAGLRSMNASSLDSESARQALIQRLKSTYGSTGRSDNGTASNATRNALRAGATARSNEARGADVRVYKLKKDGTRSATPFVPQMFTAEEAGKKIAYWENANPGSKFVAGK